MQNNSLRKNLALTLSTISLAFSLTACDSNSDSDLSLQTSEWQGNLGTPRLR